MAKRIIFYVIALGAILFASPPLFAQTDPANVPRPPDAELSKFNRFFGRWAMRGPFAGIVWVGVTEIRSIAKGWYIEWVNDFVGDGIQRELRMIMGFDRHENRYRVWRFETTDRAPDMRDNGIVQFVGDTLVQQWTRRNAAGGNIIVENRMFTWTDSLRMQTFLIDSAGAIPRLVGDLTGPRLGARPR